MCLQLEAEPNTLYPVMHLGQNKNEEEDLAQINLFALTPP